MLLLSASSHVGPGPIRSGTRKAELRKPLQGKWKWEGEMQ